MNWESFISNLEKTADFVYGNQDILLRGFNDALNLDKEMKKMFFAMSEEDKKKNFVAIANSIIFDIALKMTESK